MIEDLTGLLAAEPFLPFRIVLTSGSSYDVTSPLQITIDQSRINYYYPASDRRAILRLNQIAAVETLE